MGEGCEEGAPREEAASSSSFPPKPFGSRSPKRCQAPVTFQPPRPRFTAEKKAAPSCEGILLLPPRRACSRGDSALQHPGFPDPSGSGSGRIQCGAGLMSPPALASLRVHSFDLSSPSPLLAPAPTAFCWNDDIFKMLCNDRGPEVPEEVEVKLAGNRDLAFHKIQGTACLLQAAFGMGIFISRYSLQGILQGKPLKEEF